MQTTFSRLDVELIRNQFPALRQEVNGHPLTYLDNAATTQRPLSVLEAMDGFYRHDNANVHRAVHQLSQRATDAFESARTKIRRFINASEDAEILFTKGCTESLNLVASSWGMSNLKAGDEILLSTMEHHADIVPWQMVAEKTRAIIRPIPLTGDGDLDLDTLQAMLTERVKLVGVVHISNSLGTINPIPLMTKMAHKVGAKIVVDGAQGLAHQKVDVRSWDVDFYAMSGHKTYGPMGIGALYGKRELLESMPPYQTGGSMIRSVSFEKTTFSELPEKFEPGTPNVAGVIGFGEAIDFVNSIGLDAIEAHDSDIVDYAMDAIQQVPGVRIIGKAKSHASIVSFIMEDIHPHDIGTIVDQYGVAIRTGHHCCMPLMNSLGLNSTARASFGVYNTREEADRLRDALYKVREVLG